MRGDPRFDFDFGDSPYFVHVDDDVDHDLTGRHSPPWTKQTHPYCYDPFTIWGEARAHEECNGTDYTDRLDQWDRSKYERLAAKHYRGQRPFDSHHCKGHLIEAFLRDWHNDPQLRLLRVVEYCHPGTGFPTWQLDYVGSKGTPR